MSIVRRHPTEKEQYPNDDTYVFRLLFPLEVSTVLQADQVTPTQFTGHQRHGITVYCICADLLRRLLRIKCTSRGTLFIYNN